MKKESKIENADEIEDGRGTGIGIGTGTMRNSNKNKSKPDAGEDSGLKAEFAEFLMKSGAIKFGSFTLKSGRTSPYFINLGSIGDGASMSALGEYYARALISHGLAEKTDVLFGPSYKGIPIAVSTSVALYSRFGLSKRFAFNRKEAKDHGDGRQRVGGGLRDGDRVGLLDDVMTTGKTKEEILSVIRSSAKAEICYVLIAVDRLERGESDLSATLEFTQKYGIPVFSIATIEEIAESAARKSLIPESSLSAITSHLQAYGGRRA
jgi:orotate phosphoribosyltransferase